MRFSVEISIWIQNFEPHHGHIQCMLIECERILWIVCFENLRRLVKRCSARLGRTMLLIQITGALSKGPNRWEVVEVLAHQHRLIQRFCSMEEWTILTMTVGALQQAIFALGEAFCISKAHRWRERKRKGVENFSQWEEKRRIFFVILSDAALSKPTHQPCCTHRRRCQSQAPASTSTRSLWGCFN